MKTIYWLPRILSLAFVLFLSLFSFDVFSAVSGWAVLLALFLHLLPVLVLLALIIIFWKHGLAGAITFFAAAFLYILVAGFYRPLSWYLAISLEAIRRGYYRERNFRSWIITIAKNLAIDYQRARLRDAGIFIAPTDAPEGNDFQMCFIPDSEPDPEERLIGKESGDIFIALMKKLPPNEAEVVFLRIEKELKFLQIAQVLGTPLNTALGRMHYARARMLPAYKALVGV